jgi:phospholipid/cholesterol/gamma-HCH transport system ATP-binding protein
MCRRSEDSLIRLDGVDKSFGRPVLRNIDLTVPAGCLYGLIGPGAAGKSVLLKIITGLLKPEAGRVLVDGTDLVSLDEIALQEFRKRFGMLFQNNALFDFMTVTDNVAFPLRRLFDLSEAEIAARVEERLACVKLQGFGERFPARLEVAQFRP